MRNGYYGIPRAIAIVVVAVLVFQMIGALGLMGIYGVDLSHANASVMVVINAVAELIVMIGIPVLLIRSSGKHVQAVFRLEGIHETPMMAQLIGVPMIIATEMIGGGLDGLWQSLIKLFPPVYDALMGLQRQLDAIMANVTSAHSSGELIILILGISAVPAIAEEAFFRGLIQTNIERSGKGKPRPFLAIAITSILFGAMHMSPLNLPGLVSMGAVLGWLAYRTADLRVSMLAHAMNNGIIVLATYFFVGNSVTAQSLSGTPDIPIVDSIILIALGLPFLAALLLAFQKMTDPLHARDNAMIEINSYNSQTETPTSNVTE